MGTVDKMKNTGQGIKGKAKEATGAVIGDHINAASLSRTGSRLILHPVLQFGIDDSGSAFP